MSDATNWRRSRRTREPRRLFCPMVLSSAIHHTQARPCTNVGTLGNGTHRGRPEFAYPVWRLRQTGSRTTPSLSAETRLLIAVKIGHGCVSRACARSPARSRPIRTHTSACARTRTHAVDTNEHPHTHAAPEVAALTGSPLAPSPSDVAMVVSVLPSSCSHVTSNASSPFLSPGLPPTIRSGGRRKQGGGIWIVGANAGAIDLVAVMTAGRGGAGACTKPCAGVRASAERRRRRRMGSFPSLSFPGVWVLFLASSRKVCQTQKIKSPAAAPPA